MLRCNTRLPPVKAHPATALRQVADLSLKLRALQSEHAAALEGRANQQALEDRRVP